MFSGFFKIRSTRTMSFAYAAALALLAAGAAHSQSLLIRLYARQGTIALPGPSGPVSVPVWGFTTNSAGPCEVPGPVLTVNQGTRVTVVLTNELPEATSVVFPGQDITPAPVKDGETYTSYVPTAAPNGGVATYRFNASRPGTYVYESGTDPQKQVQMGLYGALIIRPRNKPKQAYTETGTEFEDEKVLVLSEIDVQFHQAVQNGQVPDVYNYDPDYWLINGRCYPDTVSATPPSASQPQNAVVETSVGSSLLLRCLNAGFQNHAISANGLMARTIGANASSLWKGSVDTSYLASSTLIASGETYDLRVEPSQAADFHVYDRDLLHTTTANSWPGGMIGLIRVAPANSDVSLPNNPKKR